MAGFWRPGATLPGADAEAEAARDLPKDAEVPAVQFNPLHGLSMRAQRSRLPVSKHREEILYAVETHATTILVGATGSGKTTQVPQYLMEAGWAASRSRSAQIGSETSRNRIIVCTQPRRVAAVTIAERVAQEMGCRVGEEVGYAVRFEEKWDPERTKVKFVTDGLLLRETMRDPLLSRYSVVMLPMTEFGDGSTAGLIKKIQRKRPDLRVIIASATLQVDTFVKFFRRRKEKDAEQGLTSSRGPPQMLQDVVAVSVEGRQFPVDIEYLQEPCGDYLQKAIDTVLLLTSTKVKAMCCTLIQGIGKAESRSRRTIATWKMFPPLHARTLPQQTRKRNDPTDATYELATVALYLLSMGIQDLAHFDFVSPPSPEALIRALELLFSLGAIDTECRLIDPLGTQMAEFPVAPALAKVLLSSFQFDSQVRCSPSCALACYRDSSPSQAVRDALQVAGEEHCSPSEEDYVRLGSNGDEAEDKARSATIRKCLVSGYFANAAKLHADGVYRTLRDQRPVQLHPTSVYYHMGTLPDWVIFHQSVLTTEEFVRDVSRIDPRWLVDLAPDFYRTKDVSRAISGSSGALGLPSASSSMPKSKKQKIKASETDTPPRRAATGADGRILFRKPKRSDQDGKSKLPVHIGKSKGGLRSQF
ncbi:P-loop containing nucleoside triphosphate hydrolase [Phytophthora cactorum]|nr:P-loop containing nucleoside triphosphate hydrolase [Phytophthora cactorum]